MKVTDLSVNRFMVYTALSVVIAAILISFLNHVAQKQRMKEMIKAAATPTTPTAATTAPASVF